MVDAADRNEPAVGAAARVNVTTDHLRRYAVARSLFRPTTLGRAIRRLGFVQADPIRAPARAQDLTLRHRVVDYRSGDLERRYPRLPIEEDFFVNYGFLPREHSALMHPRVARRTWSAARLRQAEAVLEFVRARRTVHPREVDAEFAHGRTRNWFGGSSNASTQLLDEMHYRGLLRVVRREGGTRVYAPRTHELAAVPDAASADARMDSLVDLIVGKYAPLPARSLGYYLSLLCIGVPQWRTRRAEALGRARTRLGRTRVEQEDWFFPADENPASRRWRPDEGVRLLTPFDPVVHDRWRFERLWGWRYRFEAYTPPAKRKLGYYALPLLWGERVIGWGNLSVEGGQLRSEFGYVSGAAPREARFRKELDADLRRIRDFLGMESRGAPG
jgi:uncharacterized protein YcaQ